MTSSCFLLVPPPHQSISSTTFLQDFELNLWRRRLEKSSDGLQSSTEEMCFSLSALARLAFLVVGGAACESPCGKVLKNNRRGGEKWGVKERHAERLGWEVQGTRKQPEED